MVVAAIAVVVYSMIADDVFAELGGKCLARIRCDVSAPVFHTPASRPRRSWDLHLDINASRPQRHPNPVCELWFMAATKPAPLRARSSHRISHRPFPGCMGARLQLLCDKVYLPCSNTPLPPSPLSSPSVAVPSTPATRSNVAHRFSIVCS